MAKNIPNRREKSELCELKEDVAARSRGAGAGVNVLARAQKAHPNDPKKQLAAFHRDFVIKSGTGRLRPISQRTSDRYIETLMMVIDELRQERAAIRNLSELRKVHVQKLIARWIRKGQSSGTIQNKTSILRRFLVFIGKDNLVPRGARLSEWLTAAGIQPPESRTIVARESKAWDEHGVDVFEIVKKIEQACPVTANQLEMQVAFGLRVNESLSILPNTDDRVVVLSVSRGTKGGLHRDVRFDEDLGVATWQRDVLERAKEIASQNPKGTLSIRGKSLEESRAHFYYIVRKFGISRGELGVTAHGLRHQFAARRYKEYAGFGAPVTAHAPANSSIVAKMDLEARIALSPDLGHFRHTVVQSYTGSFQMNSREASKFTTMWIKQTEGNPRFVTALAEAGIVRAWLGGSFAEGRAVGPHEKLRLILAPAPGVNLDANQRFVLKNALNEIYRRGVDMSMHYEQGDPDDCVELHLPTTNTATPKDDEPKA
jgi:site-specific recombinase XerC